MAKKRMSKQRKAAARDVQRRLKAYSKAATAVLALGGGAALSLPDSSEAAVVTGAINKTVQAPLLVRTSHTSSGFTSTYSNFDLDGDGTSDVDIGHFRSWSTSLGTSFSFSKIITWAHVKVSNGSVKAFSYTGIDDDLWWLASTLNTSVNLSGPFDTNQTAVSTALGRYRQGTSSGNPQGPYTVGQFPGAGPKFVGIKFKGKDGCMHYGWVRVEVPANVSYVKVLDYAYETECNKPIHVEPPAVGGMVHDVSDAPAAERQR